MEAEDAALLGAQLAHYDCGLQTLHRLRHDVLPVCAADKSLGGRDDDSCPGEYTSARQYEEQFLIQNNTRNLGRFESTSLAHLDFSVTGGVPRNMLGRLNLSLLTPLSRIRTPLSYGNREQTAIIGIPVEGWRTAPIPRSQLLALAIGANEQGLLQAGVETIDGSVQGSRAGK